MKTNEILTEANRYDDMFQVIYDEIGNMYDYKIKEAIRWAKQELKRKDAIIWYLRIYRIALLEHHYKKSTNKQAYSLLNSAIKSYNKKARKNIFSQSPGIEVLRSNKVWVDETAQSLSNALQHYLSLPIREIQNYRFFYEHPEDVLRYFYELEQEWKEEVGDGLIPDKGEKVFLDVGNGFVWFDLQRSSCDEEGEMMGHCGNSPDAYNPDVTILSLREKKIVNGELYWRPVVTFIWNHKTGYLGEMKGRGNDKPSERYHRYIVPLIMDNRIKGLNGGGYLPESNFKVTDLPNWEQLVEKKPHLMEIGDYINRFGPDESVLDRIELENDVVEEDGTKYVLLENSLTYSGTELINYYGDDTAKYIVRILNGDEFIETDVTFEVAMHQLDGDIEDEVIELAQYLMKDDGLEEWEYEDIDINDAARYLRNEHEDIMFDLDNAANDAERYGLENDAVRNLKKAIGGAYYGDVFIRTSEEDNEFEMDIEFLLDSDTGFFLDNKYKIAVNLREVFHDAFVAEKMELGEDAEMEVDLNGLVISVSSPDNDFDDEYFDELVSEVVKENMPK